MVMVNATRAWAAFNPQGQLDVTTMDTCELYVKYNIPTDDSMEEDEKNGWTIREVLVVELPK